MDFLICGASLFGTSVPNSPNLGPLDVWAVSHFVAPALQPHKVPQSELSQVCERTGEHILVLTSLLPSKPTFFSGYSFSRFGCPMRVLHVELIIVLGFPTHISVNNGITTLLELFLSEMLALLPHPPSSPSPHRLSSFTACTYFALPVSGGLIIIFTWTIATA